jgi:hypothetical protein
VKNAGSQMPAFFISSCCVKLIDRAIFQTLLRVQSRGRYFRYRLPNVLPRRELDRIARLQFPVFTTDR